MRRQREHTFSIVPRRCRGAVAWVFMLAVIVAASILRPLVGPAVMRHNHHDLGEHTHVGPVIFVADQAGHCKHDAHAEHAHTHDLDESPEIDTAACCNLEAAVVHLIDEHGMMTRSAAALRDALAGLALHEAMPAILTIAWKQDAERGRAGVCLQSRESTPRHHCALSVSARLIATSGALLI